MVQIEWCELRFRRHANNKVAMGRPCYLGDGRHLLDSCFTIMGLKTEAEILRSHTPSPTTSYGQLLWF